MRLNDDLINQGIEFLKSNRIGTTKQIITYVEQYFGGRKISYSEINHLFYLINKSMSESDKYEIFIVLCQMVHSLKEIKK